MITHLDTLTDVTAEHLGGFFIGWRTPPSPTNHLRMLAYSDAVVLACTADRQVDGFITATTDGVSCAYVPHLEVVPAFQGQGSRSASTSRSRLCRFTGASRRPR